MLDVRAGVGICRPGSIMTVTIREYGRTVGGIGWPGDKPGFAVVIGEDWYPPIGKTVCDCYLLAEIETYDLQDMFRWCAEMAAKHGVDAFYGRWVQQPCWALRDFNQGQNRVATRQIDFQPAPFSSSESSGGRRGEIAYHMSVVRDKLRLENKSLIFGDVPGSLTVKRFSEVTPEAAAKATDEDFPALAALGYAVTFLSSFPPMWEEFKEERNPNTETRSRVTGY
jgi:hypothetical protein